MEGSYNCVRSCSNVLQDEKNEMIQTNMWLNYVSACHLISQTVTCLHRVSHVSLFFVVARVCIFFLARGAMQSVAWYRSLGL